MSAIDLQELEEYRRLELRFDHFHGTRVFREEPGFDAAEFARWTALKSQYSELVLLEEVLRLAHLLAAVAQTGETGNARADMLVQQAHADADRLAQALEQVEYDAQPLRNVCPWCGGLNPRPTGQGKPLYGSGVGHRPDCPRQAALAAHATLHALLAQKPPAPADAPGQGRVQSF